MHGRTLLQGSSGRPWQMRRAHGRRAPQPPPARPAAAAAKRPAMVEAWLAAPPAKEPPRVAAGPATVPAVAVILIVGGQRRCWAVATSVGGEDGALSAISPWSRVALGGWEATRAEGGGGTMIGAWARWRRWKRTRAVRGGEGSGGWSLQPSCSSPKP